MIYRKGTVCAAAMAVAAMMCLAPLAARDDDDAEWLSLGNSYIRAWLGTAGSTDELPVTGRWSVETVGGDPEIPDDDDKPLVYYPAGDYGYFKLKVGDQVAVVGDTATGSWSKAPLKVDPPPPGLGQGKTGAYIEGEWSSKVAEGVEAAVGIRLSLVRDQARLEFTIKNNSLTPQKVGFEMCGDAVAGSSIGQPFIPGVGTAQSPTVASRAYGTLLSGVNVPTYFEVYDDVAAPLIVARNTVNQQDCVKPDYIAIGDRADLAGYNMWITGYRPDPVKPVENLYWVLCWDQRAVQPGASRKIVTYFGVGVANTRWTRQSGANVISDSVALAVQSPPSIKYDSTVPGQNDLTPFPFQIKAYVYNLATDPGPYALRDAAATLFLPAGLKLAAGSSARQEIGPVDVNSESEAVVWNVEPTGEYCGELEYYVSVSDISGWQQTVSRKVIVPATRKSVFHYGWQLMHVPFTFNNFAIEHVFGMNPGTFGARYYDSATGRYKPVVQVAPGQGFWMYVDGMTYGRVQPLQVAADAAITGESLGKQVQEQYVELQRGFNIIGNPLVYPVYWGQVQVYNKSTNTTVSLDQAVTNNWLSRTLFTWNPQKWIYDNYKDNSTLLVPWKGYWVNAKQPVTLIFRPPVFPHSNVTALAGGY